jgi:carbon-monoxide dehydrogenase iron sulfur subunit
MWIPVAPYLPGRCLVGKQIFTFIEKCVACKSCEMACSIEHSPEKTLFSALFADPRPRQRVRVENIGAFSYPSRCQHCEDAACVAACPTGAMARDARTGAVVSDGNKCIGCWMCVMVCPFGGVSADAAGKKALKCDRCPDRTLEGLDPACVAACPTKALLYATPEEMAARQRQATARAAAGMPPVAIAPAVELWRSLRGEV